MNQTQHIFLKDARRFWSESVLSLTITVAFVFFKPTFIKDVIVSLP